MTNSTPPPPTTATITLGIETRSIDWIPDGERHGKLWHQGPLWFLGNFQYFTIAIGFIGPEMGLSLGWSVLAGALGILVGTVFMAFHASQGPAMGLPQMLQSRAPFGYRGVVVPVLAALFTYIAFNIVDGVLVGQGMDSAFHIPSTLAALGATVIAVLLGMFGHDWVHRIFRGLLVILLPLTIILSLGIVFGAAGGHPNHNHSGVVGVAFLAQFTASAAYNITYAPYVSDYSRYLPSTTKPSRIITQVFFGASASAIWLIAIGAWLASHLGVSDGLAGLQLAGNNIFPVLGDATAIFSVLALVATMGMNAYGGALTVLTVIDVIHPFRPRPWHRIVTVLVLGVLCFVVSQTIGGTAVGAVSTGLTLMLYLLVPWTATNLIDFFFVRKGHYNIRAMFDPKGEYGSWSWRGLVSFGAGLAAEIPFMMLAGYYTGPVATALGGIDIAWVVGLIVTAGVYLAVSQSLRVSFRPAQNAQGSSENETPRPDLSSTIA